MPARGSVFGAPFFNLVKLCSASFGRSRPRKAGRGRDGRPSPATGRGGGGWSTGYRTEKSLQRQSGAARAAPAGGTASKSAALFRSGQRGILGQIRRVSHAIEATPNSAPLFRSLPGRGGPGRSVESRPPSGLPPFRTPLRGGRHPAPVRKSSPAPKPAPRRVKTQADQSSASRH
jgi:hypothetical protein